MQIQTKLHNSGTFRPAVGRQVAPAVQDSVSLGDHPDKGLASFGKTLVAGGLIGGVPVLGASMGVLEATGMGFGSSPAQIALGSTQIASNLVGTGLLLAGNFTGAAVGLGASALIGSYMAGRDNTWMLS